MLALPVSGQELRRPVPGSVIHSRGRSETPVSCRHVGVPRDWCVVGPVSHCLSPKDSPELSTERPLQSHGRGKGDLST